MKQERCWRKFEPRGITNVDAEFSDLLDASNAARRDLFKKKNRPQLIIGALRIPAFQQLTGMNSLLCSCNIPEFGFWFRAALYSSVITGVALCVAALILMGFVDKFGRRAFFLEAGCEMIIYMITVAVTLALEFGEGKALPKGMGIFLVIVICLFVLAYGRPWGPLGWLVPSELFPLEMRSAGQSVVVCNNLLFTALIAQCFLITLCHLKLGIFLLFGAMVFLMSSFLYFFLP